MQLVSIKTMKSPRSAFDQKGWTAPTIRRLDLDDATKKRLFPQVPEHLLGLTE